MQTEISRLYRVRVTFGDKIIGIFDDAEKLNTGIIKVKKNGRWGVINSSGVQICACIYDEICENENGFAIVWKNGKYGIVNTDGKILCKPIYDYIWSFENGFAKVEKNGKYGFINTDGKQICKCIYEDIKLFLPTTKNALVLLGEKWHVIDIS